VSICVPSGCERWRTPTCSIPLHNTSFTPSPVLREQISNSRGCWWLEHCCTLVQKVGRSPFLGRLFSQASGLSLATEDYPSIVCQSLRSLTSDLRSVPSNLKIYRDLPASSRTKALPMNGTSTSYFEQIPQLFSAQRAWCKRRVCPATPTAAQ
jgi:hypothetical protein